MHERFTRLEQAEISKRETRILDKNWLDDHTRPAVPHYDHMWLWDSVFAAVINNRREQPDKAATEITSLFRGADARTGFIPNMNYQTGRNWRDIEALTFNRPDVGSSYSQPSIIAWGAWETYEGFEKKGEKEKGLRFLDDIYGHSNSVGSWGLKGFYDYFSNHRENGNGSKLIGNIHPHETGRDSDPILRTDVPVIPGSGQIVNFANSVIDYATILQINVKQKLHNDYPEKGRPGIKDIVSFKKRKGRKEAKKTDYYDLNPETARGVYWTNDVMFNALHVNNLRYMDKISQTLGKETEATEYKNLADTVEEEIIEKMWDEESGFFYNLDKDGKQIKVNSVTGLFPLTLDTLPENKLEKLIDKMEDPEWFKTPYPVPSIPANNPRYNPDYSVKRLWMGPVWINTNYLIAEEGLVKQIQREDLSPHLRSRMAGVLRDVVEKTEEMVAGDLLENDKTHEFYNPNNRKGYRIEEFTWSLLGLHFDKSKELLKKLTL